MTHTGKIKGPVADYVNGSRPYRFKSIQRPVWLPNYATARAWYDIVPPIRGRKTDVRPVGKRTWPSTMRLDGPDEDVVITLYNTDILRYRKSGTIIINNGGWATDTTHKEIRSITNFHVYTFNNQTWISCLLDERSGEVANVPIKNNENNLFKVNETDGRYPINMTPTFPKTHKLNRKKINAVRRKYKAAINTMQGMVKLREDGFSKIAWHTDPKLLAPYIEVFGYRIEERPVWNYNTKSYSTKEMKYPEVPGDPEVNCWIAMENRSRRYGYDVEESTENHNQFMALLASEDPTDHYKTLLWLSAHHQIDNANKVMRALDKVLLRAYRDEVFEEVEVRSGRWVTDSYAKYFD